VNVVGEFGRFLREIRSLAAQAPKTAWAAAIAYLFLFAAVYMPSYRVMERWWRRDDYNYCYLVPLIVIYLLWEKRKRIVRQESSPGWWGMTTLFLGVVLFWLGELGGEFYTIYLSSWFVLVGILHITIGWKKLKSMAFEILFVLTMFPPPNFIYRKISVQLKLLSSQIGVWLMQIMGMTAYREGNVIDLGFTKLQVVDACSGLRYLIPLTIKAVLHWSRFLTLGAEGSRYEKSYARICRSSKPSRVRGQRRGGHSRQSPVFLQ